MKLPISWLNGYTKIEISNKEFESGMTMSGTKVEGIVRQGEDIENVVTGKILTVEKHPDADKLVVCAVDFGGETVQIVTAATNVFAGAVVPVAKDGAKLPNNVTIKKNKMRGVESCGMMCSVVELNMGADAEGIMILDEDTPIGVDIREILGLNESIAEFELTSNRPDCQSVIGIAREAAVTFAQPFNLKTPDPHEGEGNIEDYANVEILDFELCPRYCGRVVKNIKIEPSPIWLQKRLECAGVRAINNIVDITNYVMLEYGQPLHAFDLADLTGSKIVVRRAGAGEKMITLDDVERVLDPDMLVIADGERPVAVAGVMGGQNSEIKDTTKAILFESANFLGKSVRITAKKLGLRTESSARFEKGISPHLTEFAINRACELIHELGAGEVVGGMIDVNNGLPETRKLTLDPDWINNFLGTNIDREFMVEKLNALGLTVDGDIVTIPYYREDVEGQADLAEEVARIYGYDKIPSTLPKGGANHGGRNDKQKTEQLIKASLTAQGLNEIMTYSFVDENSFELLGIEKPEVVRIMNPLGAEHGIMRTNMIGSMLDVLKSNYNYRNPKVWLFEMGRIYIPTVADELPTEKQIVTIGMYGDADYFDIKGVVDSLFDTLGINMYDIERSEDPVYHPGQSADIFLRKRKAGTIGRIHPDVQKRYGIGEKVYVATLDFDMLLQCKKSIKKFKPLPKYPAVQRDMAFIMKDEIPARKIEDIIRYFKCEIIEDSRIFDVYKGAQVEEGYKSVAYSITFRAADRTLTDEEVNVVIDKIVAKAGADLGAKLRE